MRFNLKMTVVFGCSLMLLGNTALEQVPAESSQRMSVRGDHILLPQTSPERVALGFEKALPRTVTVSRCNGRVIWDDDVTVRVFSPLAGRVVNVPADFEQTVSAGETLAVIESPDFGQAQSEAAKAESDLSLAKKTLARVKDLFDHGASAKKDLESAQADLDRAVSEQKRVRSRLTLYGGTPGQVDQLFKLSTPISGIVVEKNLSPGQEVRADQMLASAPQLYSPIFVISDPTRLWLALDVNETSIGVAKSGQELLVRSPAFPGRIFHGRLQILGDSLDPTTRTVKARGIVDNSERLLKAEMYVSVELLGDKASLEGAEVPQGAVFMKGEKHFVIVEESPNEFVRREVQTESEHDGLQAISLGIAPGETVVTKGSLLLDATLDEASSL